MKRIEGFGMGCARTMYTLVGLLQYISFVISIHTPSLLGAPWYLSFLSHVLQKLVIELFLLNQ